LVERLRKRAIRESRADDARDDVIRHRFDIYRDETQPVLAQFDSGVVVEFNPLGTPAEVLQRVLSVVAPIQRDLAHAAVSA
jgi:adenylate kinase